MGEVRAIGLAASVGSLSALMRVRPEAYERPPHDSRAGVWKTVGLRAPGTVIAVFVLAGPDGRAAPAAGPAAADDRDGVAARVHRDGDRDDDLVTGENAAGAVG